MTPPLLPKSCPAQVPSCLRYLLLAWPGTAITSPQSPPRHSSAQPGAPGHSPLSGSQSASGWGTVAPGCVMTLTRVPLPRAGAPSPSPGAAHPLGWLMQ